MLTMISSLPNIALHPTRARRLFRFFGFCCWRGRVSFGVRAGGISLPPDRELGWKELVAGVQIKSARSVVMNPLRAVSKQGGGSEERVVLRTCLP
jgi:hypothetical protein